MPDPITHTVNASPWIFASITATISFYLGVPEGILTIAAGGAYIAVYRLGKLSIFKTILFTLAGTAVAAIMVPGITWFFEHILLITAPPQRPLAFVLGFASIDKKSRDWLIAFCASKFQSVEVKK